MRQHLCAPEFTLRNLLRTLGAALFSFVLAGLVSGCADSGSNWQSASAAPLSGSVGPRIATLTPSGPIIATSGQIISGLRISNPNGPCVVIDRQTNVRVVDSEIGPCGGGSSNYSNANIQVIGGGNVTVEYSFLHSGNRPFIALGGATSVTFSSNIVTGPFTGGQFTGGVEFDQVNGGLVDANLISGDFPSDVVSLFESSNIRLTNNSIDVSIREPTGAGFTMGDSTTGNPGRDNYVAFNTVRQTGGVPAGVFGSAGNTILERNCLASGIQAYNYSGIFVGVTVRLNVINKAASFTPDTSALAGWSTNIDGTDCALVPGAPSTTPANLRVSKFSGSNTSSGYLALL